MYEVIILKKVIKNIDKIPVKVQKSFYNLLDDLRENGPLRTDWPNFSKLEKNLYHCHLSYKWVACWRYDEDRIIIEVYYAGSRENAPY